MLAADAARARRVRLVHGDAEGLDVEALLDLGGALRRAGGHGQDAADAGGRDLNGRRGPIARRPVLRRCRQRDPRFDARALSCVRWREAVLAILGGE